MNFRKIQVGEILQFGQIDGGFQISFSKFYPRDLGFPMIQPAYFFKHLDVPLEVRINGYIVDSL